MLNELGAKYVVSRVERAVQAKFLLRNGADAVTYPEKQIAKWAAIRYTANRISDTSNWMSSTPSSRSLCRRTDRGTASAGWISADAMALVSSV